MTTDVQCMEQAALGDVEAVGLLYDRYADVLYPIAMRIVRNPADAEDVVHDAFVSLPLRAQHYVPERGSVAGWLIILVRNLSIDHVRRHGRRDRLGELHAQRSVSLHAGAKVRNPEELLSFERTRELLISALDDLQAIHRTTLELAFFEGLTYAEIAERQDISLGTVKSRASRAMAALRHALGERGVKLGDLETPKKPD